MDPTKFTLRRSAVSPANAIFIIDCLSERDLQTGRSRLQELHDLLLARDPQRFEYNKNFVHRFEARSAAQFAECFGEVIGACELGVRPIIFIDAHGHPELGLGMPSGELVGWSTLLESFNAVIQCTQGELTVIVAACHSMSALEHLNQQARLPFAFYYGYSSEVQAGVVEAETRIIYESLLGDGGAAILDATNLQLQCFSEYEHVQESLAIYLLMASAPATLASLLPELSRAKIRVFADGVSAEKGEPLSGARKKVNDLLNSGLMATKVVEQLMHDTYRRDRVIEDIKAYLQGDAPPPLPR
jgi:hypothetical protein